MAMAEHVEALNALRAEASLAALEVDATAETVAGAHAASMCEHGFLSHWGLDGRNPYQRYAFGGVRSHVREVIHGESGAFGDDAAGRQERLAELCSAARAAGPPPHAASPQAALATDRHPPRARHTHTPNSPAPRSRARPRRPQPGASRQPCANSHNRSRRGSLRRPKSV